MFIEASFYQGGVPKTGLIPTIKIWNIDTDLLVVNDDTMSEMGSSGKYKYDFTAFNPKNNYLFQCDGVDTTLDYRFTEGSNENFIQDIRRESVNKKFLRKDSDTQFTELLYDDDETTVLREHRLTKDGDDETRQPI